jgi:uncharacterized surface protein with fasciclin (FAS1) repeats
MKKITHSISKIVVSSLLVFLAFVANAQSNVFDDIIATSNEHNYLKAALEQEGLDAALRNGTDLTVFAPTDQAFLDLTNALGISISDLLELENLSDILLYHVLGQEVPASAVTNGAIVDALSTTNTLKLTKKGTGEVFVNQAQVTGPDNFANNGVVHVTNSVLLPLETVVDVAIDNDFTILTTAVVTAELLPALTNPLAELTVFAPTDEAFGNLLDALGLTAQQLLESEDLADILLYHVLGSEVRAEDITNGAIVDALSETNTLKLTKKANGDVFVNQAKVLSANIGADNGVVHVLDAVVLPVETVADVAIDNDFTILTTAVVTAELLPALTNPLAELTVFAPTDEAFGNILAGLGITAQQLLESESLADILLYHVLGSEVRAEDITNGAIIDALSETNTLKLTKKANGDVYVNQAKVTSVNIGADNGIVHVLDAVVLPVKTVVDVALENNFTTLATAVVTAELLPALSNPLTDLTVFAPTNQAFEDLATALGVTLADILELSTLETILLYHVVAGEVRSTDLTNGLVATLNGENIVVDLTSGVKINDATVTLANVDADNGVVHVINGVLLPPSILFAKKVAQNSASMSVYPNPTVDVIMFTKNISGNYSIVDASGRVVKTGVITDSQISVNDLANGNYSLQVISTTNSFTAKFAKN